MASLTTLAPGKRNLYAGLQPDTPEQAKEARELFMSKVDAQNDAREQAITSYYDDPHWQMKMRANTLIKPNEYVDLTKHITSVQNSQRNARNMAHTLPNGPAGSAGSLAAANAPGNVTYEQGLGLTTLDYNHRPGIPNSGPIPLVNPERAAADQQAAELQQMHGLRQATETGTGTAVNQFMSATSPSSMVRALRNPDGSLAGSKDNPMGLAENPWGEYRIKKKAYGQAVLDGTATADMNPGAWHGSSGLNADQDKAFAATASLLGSKPQVDARRNRLRGLDVDGNQVATPMNERRMMVTARAQGNPINALQAHYLAGLTGTESDNGSITQGIASGALPAEMGVAQQQGINKEAVFNAREGAVLERQAMMQEKIASSTNDPVEKARALAQAASLRSQKSNGGGMAGLPVVSPTQTIVNLKPKNRNEAIKMARENGLGDSVGLDAWLQLNPSDVEAEKIAKILPKTRGIVPDEPSAFRKFAESQYSPGYPLALLYDKLFPEKPYPFARPTTAAERKGIVPDEPSAFRKFAESQYSPGALIANFYGHLIPEELPPIARPTTPAERKKAREKMGLTW